MVFLWFSEVSSRPGVNSQRIIEACVLRPRRPRDNVQGLSRAADCGYWDRLKPQISWFSMGNPKGNPKGIHGKIGFGVMKHEMLRQKKGNHVPTWSEKLPLCNIHHFETTPFGKTLSTSSIKIWWGTWVWQKVAEMWPENWPCGTHASRILKMQPRLSENWVYLSTEARNKKTCPYRFPMKSVGISHDSMAMEERPMECPSLKNLETSRHDAGISHDQPPQGQTAPKP